MNGRQKRNRKSVEIYTIILLYDASSYYSFRSDGRHYLTSIAQKRQSSVIIYFHFLLLCLFIFSFTQVGIVNGGSRVLGVTNGPETAASLLAAGLDARAAELVSYTNLTKSSSCPFKKCFSGPFKNGKVTFPHSWGREKRGGAKGGNVYNSLTKNKVCIIKLNTVKVDSIRSRRARSSWSFCAPGISNCFSLFFQP